jgi:crotonobetainyl-CoA:carnitine CoA-transferase CaiB-like acyl-CoA transferase
MLGDLGAEVVKIERPGVGDVNRHWDTSVNGDSSAHVWVNRNKQSLELDLKSDEGHEIFMDLAERADVVVQNFSPGVVEKLSLDYESVRERNEDIVYINISGFGRSGPYQDRKAYDLVMQGETGLILLTGPEDSPAKIPLSVCDINAAMYGTMSALTSLYHREATGDGQEVDVTMFGGMLSWLGYFPLKYMHNDEIPERVGMRHHLLVPYGPHTTADDQYINFAVLSEVHWETFCSDIIERPDLLEDERFETNEKRVENRETLEPIIDEEIASHSRDHWAERLDDAGIPWGDVNQIDEVIDHPQTEHLNMIREIETDDGPLRVVDNPLEMSQADIRRDPMPDLGEHSAEILDGLGYSEEEIRALQNSNVI